MASKTTPCKPDGYDSDLSDTKWELIKSHIYPANAKRGRGKQREPAWTSSPTSTKRAASVNYLQATSFPAAPLTPRYLLGPSKACGPNSTRCYNQPRLMQKSCHAQHRYHRQPNGQRGHLLAVSNGYNAGKNIEGRKRLAFTDKAYCWATSHAGQRVGSRQRESVPVLPSS